MFGCLGFLGPFTGVGDDWSAHGVEETLFVIGYFSSPFTILVERGRSPLGPCFDLGDFALNVWISRVPPLNKILYSRSSAE